MTMSFKYYAPEPPKELWLYIDFEKIDFTDMKHVKFICKEYPETYNTINMMYKIYNKDLKSYINVIQTYDLETKPPMIMKKPPKKIKPLIYKKIQSPNLNKIEKIPISQKKNKFKLPKIKNPFPN